jgi:hypothetical protein
MRFTIEGARLGALADAVRLLLTGGRQRTGKVMVRPRAARVFLRVNTTDGNFLCKFLASLSAKQTMEGMDLSRRPSVVSLLKPTRQAAGSLDSVAVKQSFTLG